MQNLLYVHLILHFLGYLPSLNDGKRSKPAIVVDEFLIGMVVINFFIFLWANFPLYLKYQGFSYYLVFIVPVKTTTVHVTWGCDISLLLNAHTLIVSHQCCHKPARDRFLC